MRARPMLILLCGLMILVFLFGTSIYKVILNSSEKEICSINQLMNEISLLEKSTRIKQIQLERLDTDPVSEFLRLRKKYELSDVNLISTGNNNGDFDSQVNFPAYHDNNGTVGVEGSSNQIRFSGNYYSIMKLIKSIEDSAQLRKISSITIEPADSELMATLEFVND